MTISEKLSETIAQKERIASAVALQSDKIAEINSGIYDILESEEVPKSFGAKLVDGTITEITASDLQGATSIRQYAFYFNGNLASIEIPNGVTSIGNRAFYNCTNLTSVVIPNGMTSIGDDAFLGCGLTSVVIPNSVTSIGSQAFYQCKSLTSVVIGDNVTSIGNGIFYYCNSLTSVVIPDGVTSIGNQAFNFCKSLTSVVIPDGVTSIGQLALQIGSSSNLATITFLSTIPPTINSNTFHTSYLQNIIVPKGYGDTYKNATNWSAWADYIIESET